MENVYYSDEFWFYSQKKKMFFFKDFKILLLKSQSVWHTAPLKSKYFVYWSKAQNAIQTKICTIFLSSIQWNRKKIEFVESKKPDIERV